MRAINTILKTSPILILLVFLLFVILSNRADRIAYNKYFEDTLSRYSSDAYSYYHNDADVDLVVNDENCSKLSFCFTSKDNETLDSSCSTIVSKYREVGQIGQRRFLEKCMYLNINKIKKRSLN
jgi:hypothetical protein